MIEQIFFCFYTEMGNTDGEEIRNDKNKKYWDHKNECHIFKQFVML